MTDQRKDERKLRWLWGSSAAYFVLVLFGLRYASTVPYQVFFLAGVLNLIMMFTLVHTIRRVYLRTRTKTTPTAGETDGGFTPRSIESDRRRLRWLWAGAIIYVLACVNALSYLRQMSHGLVFGISILNVGIAAVFLLEITRTYRRLRR
jgi:hypothetical protein